MVNGSVQTKWAARGTSGAKRGQELCMVSPYPWCPRIPCRFTQMRGGRGEAGKEQAMWGVHTCTRGFLGFRPYC